VRLYIGGAASAIIDGRNSAAAAAGRSDDFIEVAQKAEAE
jgi:small subunit ribosomal protein S2